MDQKIKGIVVQYTMITLSCALYAAAAMLSGAGLAVLRRRKR